MKEGERGREGALMKTDARRQCVVLFLAALCIYSKHHKLTVSILRWQCR